RQTASTSIQEERNHKYNNKALIAKSRSFGRIKGARGRFRERFFLVAGVAAGGPAFHQRPAEVSGPRLQLISIAVRKFLVPFPGALDDGVKRLELRAPAGC